MSKLLAILACLTLAACEATDPVSEPDQCLRTQLFQQCMERLPAGPAATKYSDWDEVVESCQQASYYQSLRAYGSVKAECSAYSASKGGANG